MAKRRISPRCGRCFGCGAFITQEVQGTCRHCGISWNNEAPAPAREVYTACTGCEISCWSVAGSRCACGGTRIAAPKDAYAS